MTTTSFRITKEERFFYASTFKQLSAVQARQVGLVVGAAVADAAARALDGVADVAEIAALEAADGEIAFTPVHLSPSDRRGDLAHHSYSHCAFAAVLHSMVAGRGLLELDEARARLTALALEHPSQHALHHAQLLHTACVIAALPALYPYCDDEPLRDTAAPLVDFLTLLPATTQATSAADHKDAVADSALSWLSAPMRFLQTNPDAVKNAAFVALPGAGAIFPRECHAFLPEQAHSRLSVSCCAAGPQQEVLRDAMSIARRHADYSVAVREAIRAGGPTCQRAMLVGAMLGAKLGVRAVPQEWVRAMRDHAVIVPQAVACAQWAWNPPS